MYHTYDISVSSPPCPYCDPFAQHTKRPGYDHFGGFFGRGVFTADGEEWRRKRSTVAHALFRGSSAPAAPSHGSKDASAGHGNGGSGGGGGGSGTGLAVLANEEADSLLREVEALRQEEGEVSSKEKVSCTCAGRETAREEGTTRNDVGACFLVLTSFGSVTR